MIGVRPVIVQEARATDRTQLEINTVEDSMRGRCPSSLKL